MKYLFLFIFIFSLKSILAQSSAEELGYFFKDLEDELPYFQEMIKAANENSLYFLTIEDNQAEDPELIEEAKISLQNDLNELDDWINRQLNEIQSIEEANENFEKRIKKDLPYVPWEYKESYKYYLEALNLYYHSYNAYSAHIDEYKTLLQKYYGNEDLNQIPYNDTSTILQYFSQKNPIDTSIIGTFQRKLWSKSYNYSYHYGVEDEFYLNQNKFMKKNKIDSIKIYFGYGNEEIAFLGHNSRKKHSGLFLTNLEFNLDSLQTIFTCSYDSIQNDFGRDWTTAIAYKNEKAIVKEILAIDSLENEERIITYNSKYSNISLPKMNGLTYGIVAVEDSSKQAFYWDISKDAILTPIYPNKNYLPIVRDGSILAEDFSLRLNDSVWYYVDFTAYPDYPGQVSGYRDPTGSYDYKRDGTLDRKAISNSVGDIIQLEQYYTTGELYVLETIDSLKYYYKNGQLMGEYGLRAHDIKRFQKESLNSRLGKFITYYDDGSIHQKGSFDTTSYLWLDQFINKKTNLNGPYESYYKDGTLMDKGLYNQGVKSKNWEHFTPFGKKVEYNKGTSFVFPVRLFDPTEDLALKFTSLIHPEFLPYHVCFSPFENLALVEGFIPGKSLRPEEYQKNGLTYCELWDTKNKRQLKSAIPVRVSPSKFISKDLVRGKALFASYYNYPVRIENIEDHIPAFVDTSSVKSNERETIEDPFIGPMKIGDSLAVSMKKNLLVAYNFENLDVINSYAIPWEILDKSERISLHCNEDNQVIQMCLDDVYYEFNIPSFEQKRKVKLSPILRNEQIRQRRFAHSGVIIQTDYSWDHEYIKTLTVINPRTGQKSVIKMMDSIQDTHQGKIDPLSKKVLFQKKGDYQTIYELVINENKEYYRLTKKSREELEQDIFNPISDAPSPKIEPVELQLVENELSIKPIDGFNWKINLANGQVTQKDTVKTVVLDSIFYEKFNHPELTYLSNLEGNLLIDYDTNRIEHYLELPISDSLKSISIIGNNIKRILFQNRSITKPIEQYVFFDINEDGEYFFSTPDEFYMGSKNLKDLVFFKHGEEYFEFEQFDLKYNRPDIILHRLGYADSTLILAYHNAYKKRLNKMGFSEEMLQEDFHLPEIEIKNFESMPNIIDSSEIDLNLHLEDSKYPLDRINVWVNDVAILGLNGISLRELNIKSIDKTINVPLARGTNKVQVSVLNQAGAESYKQTLKLECSIGKDQPDLYLITLGATRFEQSEYNLTYAAKDAEDIANQLSKSSVYKEVFTKLLTNEELTKEKIIQLKSFLEQADINDHVMIFLAGHGVLSADLDYYLATYDMIFDQPEGRGLMYEDLESLLDGIKPLQKVLFIDACHSGEIDKEEMELAFAENTEKGDVQFRAVGKTVQSKLGASNTLELTKSLFTDLRKGTGATVISSAGGMEFAIESATWQNGLFTYALIDGLESGSADLNNDGEIWLSELQKHIEIQVLYMSRGKQHPTSRIENQTVDFRIW